MKSKYLIVISAFYLFGCGGAADDPCFVLESTASDARPAANSKISATAVAKPIDVTPAGCSATSANNGCTIDHFSENCQ